jgi:hypothetical protein
MTAPALDARLDDVAPPRIVWSTFCIFLTFATVEILGPSKATATEE